MTQQCLPFYPSLQLAVHALDVGLLLKQSPDTLNESVCTSCDISKYVEGHSADSFGYFL
jgi:hypothetical protein